MYYWQVVASNDAGVMAGPVWSFSTASGSARTPCWWLARYGLTNASWEVEEVRDADGDGLQAWEEYLTGTDPTNPQSFFHVLNTSVSDGRLRVRFFGTTNSGVTAPFGMWRSTDLFDAGGVVDGSIPRSPTGTNEWTDPLPPSVGRGFYRPVATDGAP